MVAPSNTAAINLAPLPGAGFFVRIKAWVRGLLLRRLLLRLAGIETVVLEGRVYVVRAVPLGIARTLVPALVRCSRKFAGWEFDEALYDDFVSVLALGLGAPPHQIEQLTIPLWDLAPVIERIARVNGLPMLEAGADLEKLMAALTQKSIGTASTPPSSVPPVGAGSTLTAA